MLSLVVKVGYSQILTVIITKAFLSYDCEGAILTDSLTGEVVAGDGDVYLLRSLFFLFCELSLIDIDQIGQ